MATDVESAERTVTLIVPTVHHRAALFDRVLRYLAHAGFKCPIIVSDHSSPAHLDVIAGTVKRHPALAITLLQHPPEMHFLRRLVLCASAAETPLVHLHADDDFLVRPTLNLLIGEMTRRPELAAAMGLNVHVTMETGELISLPKTGIQNAKPFERLIATLETFSSVLYALRRRDEFIASLSITVDRCPDVQFWQYLETCVAILNGPTAVLADLHYVREVHAAKWSSTLVNDRSSEHFPYLILAPDFATKVTGFRAGLAAACEQRGVPYQQDAIDAGVIHLLHRGFGAMGLPEKIIPPAESSDDPMVQLSARFSDLADPITNELNRIFHVAAKE